MAGMSDVVINERIDKNGTKHQLVVTNCDRCGGAGRSSRWLYTGSTCYKCGGTGRMQVKRKIYTPEHEEKLRKQREKRAEKKRLEAMDEAEERNKKYLEEIGYGQEKIYPVLGDTYHIKDELKENGAYWGGVLIGWYFSEKPTKYETYELETEKLICFNSLGQVYTKDLNEYEDYVKGVKKIFTPQSEWIGEIGKRLDLELTIDGSHDIDTAFGWSCINKLKDNNGNIFIWMTQKDLEFMHGKGEMIQLKGTIKDHSKYRDEKQTVLTRCKIIEK